MAIPYTFVNGTPADADEVNSNFIYVLSEAAYNYSQLAINILINSAAISSTLNPYDEMVLDIFNSASGQDGTVDTGNTTAGYEFESYYNGSFGSNVGETTGEVITSNTVNFSTKGGLKITTKSNQVKIGIVTKETGDNSTHAYLLDSSKVVLKTVTFTGDNADLDVLLSANTTYYIASDLNGASNSRKNKSSGATYPYSGTYLDIVGALYQGADNIGRVVTFTTINAEIFSASNTIVQTNAQTITANPIAHQVYSHFNLAGTASITYDISFDGGSTWVTGQALNTYNTSVHSGSSLKIKLNLNGTGSGNVVSASDYAVMLFY